MNKSLLLPVAISLVGCGERGQPSESQEKTVCTDCTPTATDSGSDPSKSEGNFYSYTYRLTGLAIDETGNAVPGITVDDEVSLRLQIMALPFYATEPGCEIWYEVTESTLVDTDEVFDFEFGGQSLNVWRWTFQEISDGCDDTIATPADLAALEQVRPNPEEFAALGTTATLEKTRGVFGIWRVAPGTTGPLDPAQGMFMDTSVIWDRTPPIEWDGSDPVIYAEGVPTTMPDEQSPGEVLQSVFFSFIAIAYTF